MKWRIAFFVAPLIALAQTAPPETDQALRARVSEFFQAHVDGNYRKAFELVADDTKDYYFGAQKNQLKSFQIDKIDYAENFTNADVQLTAQRMWKMSAQFPETLVTVPMRTTWKIEGGKWVFYHDPKNDRMFPMATGNGSPPKPEAGGTVKVPDLSEKAVAAAAQKILQQSSVDKSQVTLATNKASSEQVVFHNGFQGWVQVYLDAGNKIPGFSAELDKAAVNASEDAVVKLRYEPTGDGPPPSAALRLTILPFNQVFPITVMFEKQ